MGGQASLLSLLFPPVLVYRLFLQLEFKDTRFVYQIVDGSIPLATILGEDVLTKVCMNEKMVRKGMYAILK